MSNTDPTPRAPTADAERDRLPLVAFHRGERPAMRIVPSSRWRDWMNETVARNANRCLPLLTANEAGWTLLNVRRFRASWTGEDDASTLTVDYDGAPPAERAVSMFGYGIVTFIVPFVFRTPPGFDLLARGPANMPKDGASALEGLVETDWATSTFTMNWKLTRPGEVVFEQDEPFCMIVPHRRHDLERFDPAVSPLSEDPGLEAGWDAFDRGRREILMQKFFAEHTEAYAESREAWEGDYFRGRTADGRPAPEHKTKRRLRPFPD